MGSSGSKQVKKKGSHRKKHSKSARSQGTTIDASLTSLVDRSIQAWHELTWVGQPGDRSSSIKGHTTILRKVKTVDHLLKRRDFWFFQLRNAFLQQDRFMKWDITRLEDYIVLPVNYGFVNNRDCWFVSHYWREKNSPDPDGEDLRMIKKDIVDESWSYIWVDWTCMPQGNDEGVRTSLEKNYFKLMLAYIPMLVRDCAFVWNFPATYEPRAWILYEVAEFVLCHIHHEIDDGNRPFINHIWEMVYHPIDSQGNVGVRPVLKKYKYKCTNDADMDLVTGWLEILVIMARCFPVNIAARQDGLDYLNKPVVGSFSNPFLGIEVDKAEGIIRHEGVTYRFTPIFRITADV